MRFLAPYLLPVISGIFLLPGCSTTGSDQVTASIPTAMRTQVSFDPIDREQARRYLEIEKQTYKQYTEPMISRKEGLERGRQERYGEIEHEFPECGRQKHCVQGVSTGDIKKFERYNELLKSIHAYDIEIIELDTAIRDWKSRLELRTRAILNRFIVHEVLQIPTIEPKFRGLLVYSLQSFESRRQLSRFLLRYGPDADSPPELVGDYDFRMLSRPVDEAAVIATFDVYLMPTSADPKLPTRYVVSMLVNTQQLDLSYYDKDFLRYWADRLAEPYQNELRKEVRCGLYSIASETLAPRFGLMTSFQCGSQRTLFHESDASKFAQRFVPDQWMLPLSYFVMSGGSSD